MNPSSNHLHTSPALPSWDSSPSHLHGVLPVLQLPYDDSGAIDGDTLKAEIDWVFGQGVDGITLAMVTEVLRLTDEERDKLTELAVGFTNGRGPVIASVGDESSAQAVRHARAAEAAGADALMAIPPTLTPCDESGIREYYQAILDATSKPVIIQDASGYVGSSIPVQLQAALFREHPNRIMFKPEAQPIGPNLSALRDATEKRAPVFEGTGGISLVDSYHRGIAGTMPGAEVCWAIVALWKALGDNDEDRVQRIHGPLSAMISLQTNLDAFIAIEKMLLVEQGVFKNTRVRGPVGYRLDPETQREILRLHSHLKRAVQD